MSVVSLTNFFNNAERDSSLTDSNVEDFNSTFGAQVKAELLTALETMLCKFTDDLNVTRNTPGGGTAAPSVAGVVPLVTQGGEKYAEFNSGNYLRYNGNNVDFSNEFCWRFKLVTRYSGSPVNTKVFVSAAQGTGSVNQVYIRQDTSGDIYGRIYNSGGSLYAPFNISGFSPVAFQEYEIELNIKKDATAQCCLFVDGVQLGSAFIFNSTRTNNIDRVLLNSYNNGTQNNGGFLIRDFQSFDKVQHVPTDNFSSEIPRKVNLYGKYRAANTFSVVADAFYAFDAEQSSSALIKWQARDITNDKSLYYNTVSLSWEEALSYDDANTLSELLAAPPVLDITDGVEIKMMPIIEHDGSENPYVKSYTITYDIFVIKPSCNQCTIYGYLGEECIAKGSVELTFKSKKMFAPQDLGSTNLTTTTSISETVTTRSDGYFEIVLPETESSSTVVEVTGSYEDSLGNTQSINKKIYIPNVNGSSNPFYKSTLKAISLEEANTQNYA